MAAPGRPRLGPCGDHTPPPPCERWSTEEDGKYARISCGSRCVSGRWILSLLTALSLGIGGGQTFLSMSSVGEDSQLGDPPSVLSGPDSRNIGRGNMGDDPAYAWAENAPSSSSSSSSSYRSYEHALGRTTARMVDDEGGWQESSQRAQQRSSQNCSFADEVLRLRGGGLTHYRRLKDGKMQKYTYQRNWTSYKFKHGQKHAGQLKFINEKLYITKNGRWAKKRKGFNETKYYGKSYPKLIGELVEDMQMIPDWAEFRLEKRQGLKKWEGFTLKRNVRKKRLKAYYKAKAEEEFQKKKDRLERHDRGIYSDSDGNIQGMEENLDKKDAEAAMMDRKIAQEEAKKEAERKEQEKFQEELKGSVFADDEGEMDFDTADEDEDDSDEGEDGED